MTFSLSLKASSYCLLMVRSYSLQVISGNTLAREITPPGAPIIRPLTKKLAEPGITWKVHLPASRKLSMLPVEESLTPTILGCLARSFTRLTDKVVPPQNCGALYTRHGVVRLPATSVKYLRRTVQWLRVLSSVALLYVLVYADGAPPSQTVRTSLMSNRSRKPSLPCPL